MDLVEKVQASSRIRCAFSFAFDFLTYVVYERGEYYAYRELKKRYPVVCLCGGLHRLKCRKFLFRLSNYVHPSLIRIYGT